MRLIFKDFRGCLFTVLLLFLTLQSGAVNAQLSLDVDRIIALGDSLTAGTAGNGQGLFVCTVNGLLLGAAEQGLCRGEGAVNKGGWVPETSQLTGTDVFNFGNAGDTAEEIQQRLAGTLNSVASTHVIIMAGTNDVIFDAFGFKNIQFSDAIISIRTMVQQVLDAGRVPIVSTIPPLEGPGIPSAAEDQVQALNALIEDLPNQFPNLQIADVYNQLAPNWAQHTSGDFIHIGPSGNTIVANEWSKAINRDLNRKKGIRAIAGIITTILLDDEEDD